MKSMFISKLLLYPDHPRNLVWMAPKTTVIPLVPGTFQYRDWKFMYFPSLFFFFFAEESLYSTSRSWHVCKIQLGKLLEKLLFTEIKLYMRPKQCPHFLYFPPRGWLVIPIAEVKRPMNWEMLVLTSQVWHCWACNSLH